MQNHIDLDDQLGLLAEAFVLRYRHGENPSISEYMLEHPALADRINKLFPTLVLMEELSPEQRLDDDKPVFREKPTPKQLGDFQILEEIGRGGMGIVYRARQVLLGREVALKVLNGPHSLNTQSLERFQLEARSAARLHHPNIVPVFEVGNCDETYYYAMQLIHGQGLDQVLEKMRRGGLLKEVETLPAVNVTNDSTIKLELSNKAIAETPTTDGMPSSTERFSSLKQNLTQSSSHRIQWGNYRRMAEIGLELAEAIAFAHEQGILHRDLKPSNLLLDHSGHVWVTDFGLAKALETTNSGQADLTGTGDVIGTIRYMAPERFRGWSDPRSDVYGIGITLYELLTLRPAFEGQDRLGLMEKVRSIEPVRPCAIDRRVPRDLETIVLKAIEKEPSARYDSAAAMAQDLQRFLDNRSILARRASINEKTQQWLRRNPVVATLSASLFLVLCGAWLTTLLLWQRASSEAASARNHLAAEKRNLDLAVSAVDQFSTKVSKDLRMKEQDVRPLRQDLLKTAVEFHEQLLQLRGNSKPAQIDLARAYQNLANLTSEIDAQAKSVALYQQAVKAYELVLLERAGDLQIQLELSRCLGALGHLLADTGNATQADLALEHSVEILMSILNGEPTRMDARIELGRVLVIRATVLRDTKRTDQARITLSEAAKQWELLLALQPKNARFAAELANDYLQLSMLELFIGIQNWRAAEAELESALSILRPLIDQADVGDFELSIFASILEKLGRVAKISSRYAISRNWLKESIAVQAKLIQKSPSVLRYRHEMAMKYRELGQCESVDGNESASIDANQRAIEIWERLVNESPGNLSWEANLATSLNHSANQIARNGRLSEALLQYGRSVELLESTLQTAPLSISAQNTICASLAGRATLLADMGHFERALADWDRAMMSGNIELLDSYRLKRAWTVVNLGDFESAVATTRDVLHSGVEERAKRSSYLIGAKTLSLAVGLARSDTKLDEFDRRSITDGYALDAIEFIKLALKAGAEDSVVQGMTEFDTVRERSDFKELFH